MPVSFSRTPAQSTRPAPALGEHGPEILAEVGFSESEIAELQNSGALYVKEKV